ncbi:MULTISPECIES: acetyl-CoA carboxylase biotin carboxyl carrier protein [Sporosarcina]|uniref:acetyl-CoA carboxylase biotin carboxyl carrier protein n=1 Tax=Sporosarcina TaxID=1569 RepID=UPI00058AD2B5|nr:MULTISPECIES: acetyl-CoA carboxylase biotin carboxyl carrier protein [Sporosarcina]WJY28436.1 acetyl-CoA carboxylase biotin carboxyl carrier protein [Sporosarcina sp. 0.2-SM1T-5]
MLKIQEIREIIKLIDQSSIDKFTYEAEGTKLKIVKSAAQEAVQAPVQAKPVQQVPDVQDSTSGIQAARQPEPAVQETPKEPASAQQEQKPAPAEEKAADPSLKSIVSPMVGTFYKSSSPEAEAYVQVGKKVGKEDVVCIVEAMKLFNEIEAEVSGEIVEILVQDGQLVEYGQPLFLVKEN